MENRAIGLMLILTSSSFLSYCNAGKINEFDFQWPREDYYNISYKRVEFMRKAGNSFHDINELLDLSKPVEHEDADYRDPESLQQTANLLLARLNDLLAIDEIARKEVPASRISPLVPRIVKYVGGAATIIKLET